MARCARVRCEGERIAVPAELIVTFLQGGRDVPCLVSGTLRAEEMRTAL